DMADITISDTKLYIVIPVEPVEIRVEIGDAQVGGTSIMLDGVQRQVGDEWERIGGPGEDLSFKVVHCVTTVRDVNAATNHTSVTYTLRGGLQQESFPYDAVVSEGGVARYVIDF